MKTCVFFALVIASLGIATPIKEGKRQVNGLLSSLASLVGDQQTFDYVVLGGGTAGLTIAKRLAEDPEITVAVIEAGTLYQLVAPVTQETPALCVVGVGKFGLISRLHG